MEKQFYFKQFILAKVQSFFYILFNVKTVDF